ncbi:translation initiation factor IF-2-like [Myotis myotis]|uniref:translation initiation factor IF-2-like n=1 Tax=Myotis myotis TaxID=51298 RepID=UPI00174A4393|nr:translation initiation factor IF-2-like [Myotis myotis]
MGSRRAGSARGAARPPVPGGGARVRTCRCRAPGPAGRPGGAGPLGAGPASGHRLGPSRGPAPGSAIRGAPGPGGAHLAEPRTWPGRGAGPRAPNPGFGASGFGGGRRFGFPRCPPSHAPSQPSPARPLASPPRVARGVAARGLAPWEREGAWPGGFFLKWPGPRPARAEGDVVVGQLWLFWRQLPGRTGPDQTLQEAAAGASSSSLAPSASRELPRPRPERDPRALGALAAPGISALSAVASGGCCRVCSPRGPAGGRLGTDETVSVGSWGSCRRRGSPWGPLELELVASPDKGPGCGGVFTAGARLTSSPAPRERFLPG